MNQLAGDFADDVHAEELTAGDLKDHFDHSLGVADDLAAAVIAVFVLAARKIDNLPDPDVLAQEIVEDLEAARLSTSFPGSKTYCDSNQRY